MENWVHSVSLINERCKGCTNCIKRCPTEAIRVRGGKAQIDSERCIDCGECIRLCENHAKYAVCDSLEHLKQFQYKIALPAPALLGQFNGGMSPDNILSGLLDLGFDRVVEAGYGADFITVALREFLNQDQQSKVWISSACPAVVRLIQVRFPGLVNQLIPIEAPMITAAKLAREEAVRELGLTADKIGVFFITPCPAKNTEIKGVTQAKQLINGSIAISQIFGELQQILNNGPMKFHQSRLSATGVNWGRTGGEIASLQVDKALVVDGIHNVVRVLEEIELGKLTGVRYLEAQACTGGCIGGALTVQNPYVAKMQMLNLIKTNKLTEIPNETVARAQQMFAAGEFHWQHYSLPGSVLKLDHDVGLAIQKMEQIEEMVKTLPGLDCGSCGSPHCRALAEDIVLGKAQIFDCVFKLREEVSKLAQDLVQLSQKLPPAMGLKKGNGLTEDDV